MIEQLSEVGSKLPSPALAELLDFANLLQRKYATIQAARHGSLAELRGGLETLETFVGTPLAIKEAIRRECN